MIDEPARRLDEGALRALVPRVLAGLVRRGEDFDAAEDALQEAMLEALLEALRVWPGHPPRDPRAWLTTVATRRLVDARRSEAARHRRPEVAADLARLRQAILLASGDMDVTDLLWLCFSSLIVARTSVANARDLVHSRHHYRAWERDPGCARSSRREVTTHESEHDLPVVREDVPHDQDHGSAGRPAAGRPRAAACLPLPGRPGLAPDVQAASPAARRRPQAAA